jgi:sulfide dehydrogenase [flavocytochrome c] flavoprotein subunit
MAHLTRRDFIKLAGAATALGSLGLGAPRMANAVGKARVIVVGGGYGGAIAAKYVKMADPDIDVLLIEQNPDFVSCPLSNEVLSGERDIDSLTFGYAGLSGKHGVTIMQDRVVDIDPVGHYVKGASGNRYKYDKLVVSPGVDFRWNAIQGYDEAASHLLPHAWKAGEQTLLLRRQLIDMRDGGVVYISAPPNPFRCPPGPYERAAQIAHYLKQHKPKSKVIILDAKDTFSKQGLFTAGWKEHYDDMIEWVSGASGGIVEAVRPNTRTLIGQVEEFKGDVVNVIPPQKAGAIAEAGGLTNKDGWCPVDQRTFESTLHEDVHVIGDSCIAGKMPKSGYAANSQGKVCAAALVATVNGMDPPEPSYVNTCYSLITPTHGISVAAVYQLKDGVILPVEGAGGLSPADASEQTRAIEARYARSWLKNITQDMFG